MKTTKLQLNAKSFKATRDIISAYFGAKFELAIKLDTVKKSTDALVKVIATDKEQLSRLILGEDCDGITRTADEIRESIKMNTASYNSMISPYNVLAERVSKALTNAEELFSNKDSALYKAYATYVTEPSDDNYNAYASALAARFVELGLADATADNVAHYLPNVDKEQRGKGAVKCGDIRTAVASKTFATALLGKIYANNKSEFSSKKFVDYVNKCAEQARKNK